MGNRNEKKQGENTLFFGCWVLDTGCWYVELINYWVLNYLGTMLDTGCWILDAGCWGLDAGYRMLDTGCWILVRCINQLLDDLIIGRRDIDY